MTDEEYLQTLGIEIINVSCKSYVQCLVLSRKLNEQEQLLLSKMLKAIDIAKENYIISDDISKYDYQIAFGIDVKLPVQDNHFQLISPYAILQDESLKRDVWHTLKQAQRLL